MGKYWIRFITVEAHVIPHEESIFIKIGTKQINGTKPEMSDFTFEDAMRMVSNGVEVASEVEFA